MFSTFEGFFNFFFVFDLDFGYLHFIYEELLSINIACMGLNGDRMQVYGSGHGVEIFVAKGYSLDCID